MIGAAREIIARRPAAQFEVAAVSEAIGAEIQQLLLSSSLPRNNVRVGVGENSAIMKRAVHGNHCFRHGDSGSGLLSIALRLGLQGRVADIFRCAITR